MSIVAVKKLEKGFEIASDSITVRGYTKRKGDYSNSPKLFKSNGLIIGGVGTAEETSLLQIFCGTHKPSAASEYALLEFLSEFADWKKKKTNNYNGVENPYLICFEGRIFSAYDFFIEEILTFEAIGAGMDYALAAMHLGHGVRQAVESAIELCVYCEKPIIHMTSEDK